MKICYKEQRFQAKTKIVIDQANEIIGEYMAQGYRLTLRQLHYQFVARDLRANTEAAYKQLSKILSDARYAGLLDWSAIEDRGRPVHTQSHWRSPSDILRGAAYGYATDKWADQQYRPEVWIEKEALIGVIEPTCEKWDLSFFACKGYSSSSCAHEAAMRLREYANNGQQPVILYLGDLDPSGEDMSRDVANRMDIFGVDVKIKRLALNMDQVKRYNPPPQIVKKEDVRATKFIEKNGNSCWELDALGTDVLASLVDNAVSSLLNAQRWEQATARQEADRRQLLDLSEKWQAAN
jgi:hypothetical protein